MVSDSCHSGGLISDTKEQIGESTIVNQDDDYEEEEEEYGIHVPHHLSRYYEPDYKVVEDDYEDSGYFKSRSLPVSSLIGMLKQQTGKEDIDVGKIRPTLFDAFGEDASPKVKKFMKVLLKTLRGEDGEGDILDVVGSLALEFMKQKLDEYDEDYAKPALDFEVESKQEVFAGARCRSTRLPRNGTLLSGCQSDQTSADAGDNYQGYGAFSDAIQTILAETNGDVTNEELVLQARKMLEKQGFVQRPGLYCSDEHVDAPFIC